MDDPSSEMAESGDHTPAGYVRSVLERTASGATGELRILHGDEERSLFFVDGHLLSITSTVAGEELVDTIVSSGLVDPARIEWIEKHCGPDEGIIEALLAAGTLSWDELSTHLEEQLRVMLGANLRWASGEWEWIPSDQEVARSFDPDLIPKINLYDAFVDGVRSTFPANALGDWISDEGAGTYIADARLTGTALPTWFPASLEDMPNRFAGGAEGAQLLETETDPAFPAAMWILEAVGLVHRRNPPATLVPSDTIITFRKASSDATPEQAPEPKRPTRKRRRTARAQTSKPAAAALAAPPSAPVPDAAPEPASASTADSQAEPATPPAATPEKTTKAKSSKRRTVKVKKPKRILTLPEIQERMEDGDFETALSQLEKLRNQDPSSPDVLAALGWASWRVGAQGTNAYDGPEDYLLLALTFDAEHPKALEYFARIAIETGDVENARNRLLQVLQVDPDAEWARTALESDKFSASTRTPRGRGLRFWPRGKA